MEHCPADFTQLLSHDAACGHWGALAHPRRRFATFDGYLDQQKTSALRGLLDRAMGPWMQTMADPIPPESIWDQKENYADLLPKAMRVKTAYLEQDGPALETAHRIGLMDMLQSPGLHRMAQTMAGRPLRRSNGVQLLCYETGDYSGPHHDHHPEDEAARHGYVDLHITLCDPKVERQLLVYAQAGHLTEVVDVARDGLITAYRLPFWHYVTPLEGSGRRWVLLATYLYEDPRAPLTL